VPEYNAGRTAITHLNCYIFTTTSYCGNGPEGLSQKVVMG
jgi:hypothetical protein